ncbi:MAG TPA: DUF1292 domain-containing protein [Fervidobacterium sp.]|nr:DUF1292 domain-containing protein [Fervidobacterium sp.]HPP17919.1 DUF1292 domain-containing protein [Fervidobacterium sp.]
MFENEHEHEHEHHHHEHEHEHEQDHEEDHVDAFTLVDEEGNEHNFVLLGEVENKGKIYWVCEEIFVEDEEISDFGDTFLFSKSEDQEGNVFLDSIESEDEFNEVVKVWEDMVGDEDFFVDADDEEEEDEDEEE